MHNNNIAAADVGSAELLRRNGRHAVGADGGWAALKLLRHKALGEVLRDHPGQPWPRPAVVQIAPAPLEPAGARPPLILVSAPTGGGRLVVYMFATGPELPKTRRVKRCCRITDS